MSGGLHIAPGLSLDPDYVGGGTFALLAKKGAGKTYTGRVMAEEFWKAKVPFVVLDPMDAWWGLRAGAGGKGDGIPVAIFGGDHGDAPLERKGGELMADLVVDEGLSMVLSLKGFGTRAAEREFAKDFLERLYRRNSQLVHLLIDEADLFAPQKPQAGDAPLLGITENIVRRGRNSGIGCTLITQRPAVLNKDVLTQVDGLVAMRMLGPQDRNAIDAWVGEHGDDTKARDIKGSLPDLPTGEGWWWIPELGVLERVKVRKSRTFDSSPTRKRSGERARQPKSFAEIDMGAIEQKMAATIERAKADDPKELHAQVRKLQAELAKRPDQAPTPEPERVEVPVLPRERIDHLEAALDDMRRVQEKFTSALERALDQARGPFDDGIAAIQEKAEQIRRDLARVSQTPAAALRGAAPRAPAGQGGPTRPARVARPAPAPATNGDGPAVSTSQQRILDALAMLEAIGIPAADKTQLALFARTKPTSGGYKNNLGALRNQHAYIHYPTPGTVALTDDGRAHADGTAAPSSNEELHELVRGLVPAAMWAIVDQLIEVYPNPLTREDLADRVGVPVTSGGYKNNLGRLRSLGLIDYPLQGFVEALPVLFLEGAPA